MGVAQNAWGQSETRQWVVVSQQAVPSNAFPEVVQVIFR